MNLDPASISSADRDLFEYFAELYKNSNKGIKGRGKDRKISSTRKSRAEAAKNASDATTSNNNNSNNNNEGAANSPGESSAGNSNGGEGWDFGSDTDEGQGSYDGVMNTQQMPGQLPPMRPQHVTVPQFNMGSFDHVGLKYTVPKEYM
ncbi:hypothetical protein ABW20_dc0106791 [Dactylellina cionopaga]|nr:hypothetical protein ABW20_dc0106791 [Dactylellina cionopaga]